MLRVIFAAAVYLLVIGLAFEGPADAQALPPNDPGPFEQSGTVCELQNLPVPLQLPNGCQGLTYTLAMIEVPHGEYAGTPDPTCIQQSSSAVPDALSAVVGYYAGNPAGAAGSTTKAIEKVQHQLRPQAGNGAIANFLFGKVTAAAQCIPVSAYIPSAATLIGVRAEAFDRDGGFHHKAIGWHPCTVQDQDCDIKWSRFDPRNPPAETVGNRKFITAVFMNWSHNRTRWARLIVVYKLPSGMEIGKPL